MTEVDRETFARALFVVGEAFNEPVSATRAEAYFEALREYTLAQVTGACGQAVRTSKFFPRPVELRELIEGDREEAATAAWAAVLREVRRVGYIGTPDIDERTMRAVRSLWGSWQRLCERLPSEGPELLGWIKQFKATYGDVEKTAQRALTMGDLNPNVRAFITNQQKKLR